MSEKFTLERRAEELYLTGIAPYSAACARTLAIQLARELAEAIAAEIETSEGAWISGYGCRSMNVATAAAIARSFARPRSREDVYREALERIACDDGAYETAACLEAIAHRALDEGAKVLP